jgi:ABC-type branched-subunit amino acid transport system substrate-binding protein
MHTRRLLVGRLFVGTVLLSLALGACGNSKSQTAPPTTVPVGNTPATTARPADLTKNVPRPGVKGVTATTIRIAVITAKTNPIGGRYHEYIDGIRAYFKVVNDKGGIYGRKLTVVSDRDDVVGTQNVQQTTSSLANDNAFATFEATQQLTAADMLAKAHMPTFIWNIDPEMASTPTSDHSNIFGTNAAICFSCPGPLNPWLAQKNGFTKIGILGYGVSAESKLCATGTRDAYKQYSNGKAQVVFFDDSLPFAADLTADVQNMKDKGVQYVNTCMDTNEVIKLQREMQKQGMKAVQNLPNAYDHDFVKQNAALFEGTFVESLYTPWETDPQSPETKAYLAGIKAITNDPVELTEFGWINAIQFVDGLKGAGPEFTQQKVIDYLNSQTAYSPGGLVPPINWTTAHIDPMKHTNVRAKEQCMPIMQIKGGKYVLFETPGDKPFTCLDTAKGADQTPTYKSYSASGKG